MDHILLVGLRQKTLHTQVCIREARLLGAFQQASVGFGSAPKWGVAERYMVFDLRPGFTYLSNFPHTPPGDNFRINNLDERLFADDNNKRIIPVYIRGKVSV